MEPHVTRFIRSSLIWLGVGVSIGLAMALHPAGALVYRPAHTHANLLGFVSMMIFGVAYHVLPRFRGAPLHNRRLAEVHLIVANAGLVLLVGGWLLPGALGLKFLVPAGGLISALGAGFFIYNIWRTLDGALPAPRSELVAIGVASGRQT